MWNENAAPRLSGRIVSPSVTGVPVGIVRPIILGQVTVV